MSNEIFGTDFKYTIDSSYGINKDGFIAIGTESIVYKGLKTALKGGLQFSCVLKFKPKTVPVNGEIVDRLEIFKNEELKIFEELQECRSIVRIYDVIEDLGMFSLPCDKIKIGIINNTGYFCVVEEFIDGWSLEEYCREERWKLKKVEQLENGLNKIVNYHEFTEEEKYRINLSYYKNYDNVLKYQNEIFQFMINLCDILEFVTEKKQILHMDIKPENIMVTKYGKELVLIDFGRSKRINKSEGFALSKLSKVDYRDNETVEKMFQHGTLGYAAPECYAKPADGSEFPFELNFTQGKLSIESDIFSFGATFWECLNIFELVTKSRKFSEDVHDFYKDNFLNDKAYCSRDLSFTSIHYHKKLEDVIKKCTRKRSMDYLNQDNDSFYHSYKDLRRDIEEAKNSSPTIVRSENIKVRNAFSMFGGMIALCMTFLIISGVYRIVGFSVAEQKWSNLTSNYNATQFHKLEIVADDLIKTAPNGRFDETYSMIAEFTYKNGDIDYQEAALLVSILEIKKTDLLNEYIDEIMQYANSKNFKEISTEIIKLDVKKKGIGYELAEAIDNVEVGKSGILDAYGLLEKLKDNGRFKNAVVKLKNVLDNDETIELIAKNKNVSRAEIQQFLKNVDTGK